MKQAVTEETLNKVYRPFDLAKLKCGSIVMIEEVSINDCQERFEHQVSYSVSTLCGSNKICAWFCHDELDVFGNIMNIIAIAMTNDQGSNERWVKKLLKRN